MKKNLTVLVLLVAGIVMSTTMLSSLAFASEIPEDQDTPPNEIVVPGNGAGDDGNGGDPGDAGDGYGNDLLDDGGSTGGNNGVDDSIFDEIMLILMSLIKLAQ